MRHLLTVWDQIVPVLQNQRVMLFLDFDGTLIPIVRDPNRARLTLAKKKLIQDLRQTEGVEIAIVSGRSLRDIKKRIGIPGLVYVGNHGLEFQGPKIRYVHPTARASKGLLRRVGQQLALALKPFSGVLIENKTLTLSVHYRHLGPRKVMKARKVFLKVLNPYLRYAQVHFRRGKKVWEVRPPTQWNKGRIVLWLLAGVMTRTSAKVVPVYIGDDQTDEDAFKAIGRKGIGIKVTQNETAASHASYYLRSAGEVFYFLNRLKRLKEEDKSYARL